MEFDSYMYFCPECKRLVSDQDRMCLKCGATIRVENTENIDRQLVVDNSRRNNVYKFIGEIVFRDIRDRDDVPVKEIALITDYIKEYSKANGELVLTFTGMNNVLGANVNKYTCKVYRVYMYDRYTDSHKFPFYLITGDVFYPKNGFYLLDKYIKSFSKSQNDLFFTFEKDGVEDVRTIAGVDNVQAVYNQLNRFLDDERAFRKQAENAQMVKYKELVDAIKNKYHAYETDKYYSLINQDDPNIEIVGKKKSTFAFYKYNNILYILDENIPMSLLSENQGDVLSDINRCYMIDMDDIVEYRLEGTLTKEEIKMSDSQGLNNLMGLFKKNKDVQYNEIDTRKITLTTKKIALTFCGKHLELVEKIFDDLIGPDKKIEEI